MPPVRAMAAASCLLDCALLYRVWGRVASLHDSEGIVLLLPLLELMLSELFLGFSMLLLRRVLEMSGNGSNEASSMLLILGCCAWLFLACLQVAAAEGTLLALTSFEQTGLPSSSGASHEALAAVRQAAQHLMRGQLLAA